MEKEKITEVKEIIKELDIHQLEKLRNLINIEINNIKMKNSEDKGLENIDLYEIYGQSRIV